MRLAGQLLELAAMLLAVWWLARDRSMSVVLLLFAILIRLTLGPSFPPPSDSAVPEGSATTEETNDE